MKFRSPLVVAAACLVVCVEVSMANERYRTPAEIELRRSEIAAQLAVLADEEATLARRLASEDPIEADQVPIRARLKEIASERDRLDDEAQKLAGVATRTATGPIARGDPQGLPPAQIGGSSSQVSAGTAFNPAITVIPDGLYYYDNAGGEAIGMLRGAEGFGVPGAEIEDPNVPRGFSLREVELAFSGAVDPYFDVWAVFGIGNGEIEAEEVYVQTRRFLPGVQVRFGQFFSGIGYLNRQHRHQWDFVDQALLYDALFGSNLSDVGVQATWLPALPIYMQFGFEALQGDNSSLANQLTDVYPDVRQETPGPRLFTGFVKISPDFGYSNTLQGGLSFGRSRSHQEAVANGPLTDVFDGSAWFIGTDWIWRRDSARQYGQGDVTIQGEYFYRAKSLVPVDVVNAQRSESQQDGLYAQIVYGIAPRWAVGGRFDVIGLRNQVTLGTTTMLEETTRYAADVTFNPTEFSRLRFQYNYAQPPSDGQQPVHQIYVQFQMSLGVHGAHVF